MATTPAVGAALDEIYRSLLRMRPRLAGLADREVRRPEALLALARDLDLLPAPGRVIRVTGSKGKGSVARLIAAGLAAAPDAGPVGLFVSPEETVALDRMRINGRMIDDDRFVALYHRLRPHLHRVTAALEAGSPPSYLSPFGQFLLIALAWFKESGVESMVLETGRGARFDEVGGIASAVSVVTSVLPEHLDRLGPREVDVADHKLAVIENSGATVLGPTAARWHRRLAFGGRVAAVTQEKAAASPPVPAWLALDRALARRALKLYGLSPPTMAPTALPSFGRGRIGHVALVYEAAVQRASLEAGFLTALRTREGLVACVVSLPDDKDVIGVAERLTRAGLDPAFVALDGERGSLRHAVVEERYPARLIGRCRFDDAAGLKALLAAHADRKRARSLYLVGTQTFIRLVRRVLDGDGLVQP